MTDPFLDELAGGLARLDADRRPVWYDDPARFARECIVWPEGTGLVGYQAATLASLVADRRVAVRSLHGAGKSATAALSVLWFALSRDMAGVDWKAITTASAWRQLERFLWPEIRLWARRVRWDRVGRRPFDERTELLHLNLRLEHGEAFAAASDEPAKLEGAHADSLLLVADEAKAIPAETFDALEGALAGTGEALALVQSTPGAPSGRFYEIHARKAGTEDWSTRHVTLGEALSAGRVSRDWVDQRRLQWGEDSALFANRCLGEFHADEEDAAIPLGWVEAAVDRWRQWSEDGCPERPGRRVFGLDVARGGKDVTVLVVRQGDVLVGVDRFPRQDTMVTTGMVAAKVAGHPSWLAVVDVIGVGAGVVDRLREQRCPVHAFHSSERSTRRDGSGELGMLNQRSAAWWRMRELLDPAGGSTVCLPDDDLLVGDLCAPRWSVTSAGKIQIEAKDEIRRRLGRSTDTGDATVMAFSVSAAPVSTESGRAVPYRFAAGEPGAAVPYGGYSTFTPDPAWPMSGSLFEDPDRPGPDGTWAGAGRR